MVYQAGEKLKIHLTSREDEIALTMALMDGWMGRSKSQTGDWRRIFGVKALKTGDFQGFTAQWHIYKTKMPEGIIINFGSLKKFLMNGQNLSFKVLRVYLSFLSSIELYNSASICPNRSVKNNLLTHYLLQSLFGITYI